MAPMAVSSVLATCDRWLSDGMAERPGPMTMGGLFSGIGGFELGFTRAGFDVRWMVERDPFCRKVLQKHWPKVRQYEDVRTVGSELERVDVICGGWPCQPVSSAAR